MYASDEKEEWVYLHKTPPVKTVENQKYSCSSQSDRSISLSSIELDDANTHSDLERENRSLEMTTIEDPPLHNVPDTENDNHLLPSESTVEEKELIIADDNSTVHTPVTDVLNTGFELSKTSLSLSNTRRRRAVTNAQQSDSCNSEVLQSTPVSQVVKPRKRFERCQKKNDTLISFTCMIILLILSFILGQMVLQWDQPTMHKIAKELMKTNQRLNEMKDIPIGNFEERLTRQLEEKLRNMIKQQMTWYEHERSDFISQIQGLRDILNKTHENFTNTIDQLKNENERLQEQLQVLQHRLGIDEEQYQKPCLEGVNCTKSSRLSLDKLVTNLFKQTASIAANTSVNLSGLFEHLSASVSNIVDHRHQYLQASRRKLTGLTRFSTSNKVQTSFRRRFENLSFSFRKVKLTYASWVKSRAQTRLENNSKVAPKFPWRWTFSRGRMYHQSPTKEQVCYSKFSFPMNKICSMKNWMQKLFRF